ncbi:hypothetical protein AAFF_G00391360 [Aldrovandia affinis]|uniref:TGF-beta family profile domain-containing protein n=1 Tax=Aldrovandia affinis TaxID=143900 RepID=A0AAD7WL12_9TELE|nr:hypothetical protein AAFF_G00391360 [Aldrovandia affinis]
MGVSFPSSVIPVFTATNDHPHHWKSQGFRQMMDKGSEEKLLIEIAKEQILSKLHLKERPNITQTVPRAALVTALRKLHAGRVKQDGTLEPEKNLLNSRAKDQGPDRVQKIIPPPEGQDREQARPRGMAAERLKGWDSQFARGGRVEGSGWDNMDSSGTQPSLAFQFLQEQGQSVQVLQSALWLYVHPAEVPTRDSRATAQIYLSGQEGSNRTLLLQKTLEVQKGSWHTFPVTHTLQAFLDGGQQRLRLEVLCTAGGRDLCDLGGAANTAHQPFLVAQVRLREDMSAHARSKRSLKCGDDVSVCCKKDFYIKFRDIQWQDWIIAPEGYHMNYCMGQCPQHLAGSPGIASSFHATVFSQLKANGIHTAVSSCCVPIQRRPLSMVYFNSQHSIVKTDVPDMIVESWEARMKAVVFSPLTHTLIPTGNLDSPISLPCMSLDCGRKPEYPRKPTLTRENMQTPHRKAPAWIRTETFLLATPVHSKLPVGFPPPSLGRTANYCPQWHSQPEPTLVRLVESNPGRSGQCRML